MEAGWDSPCVAIARMMLYRESMEAIDTRPDKALK
jgi:hypothetical protein